jgi:hypothetical protein
MQTRFMKIAQGAPATVDVSLVECLYNNKFELELLYRFDDAVML